MCFGHYWKKDEFWGNRRMLAFRYGYCFGVGKNVTVDIFFNPKFTADFVFYPMPPGMPRQSSLVRFSARRYGRRKRYYDLTKLIRRGI